MYYGFVDGHYVGSAAHLKYLKNRVDEDMDLFNGTFAIIYRGKRSECCRRYDGKWHLFKGTKADRPNLPSIE